MLLVDHTCATPAENLALDEALLDEAERGLQPRELLRLWESDRPMVVVGRSSKVAVEANLPACRERGVPVLRRSSGGGAIVAGPGCLMYALVLSYQQRPELRAIDTCHRLVMETIARALDAHLPGVTYRGTCDLAYHEKKFSGNALRCRREYLLYHGTLLYDFPLAMIAACLGTPPRQPEYRQQRPHEQFVANLPLARDVLRQAVIEAWQANELRRELPLAAVQQLAAEKYRSDEWNLKY